MLLCSSCPIKWSNKGSLSKRAEKLDAEVEPATPDTWCAAVTLQLWWRSGSVTVPNSISPSAQAEEWPQGEPWKPKPSTLIHTLDTKDLPCTYLHTHTHTDFISIMLLPQETLAKAASNLIINNKNSPKDHQLFNKYWLLEKPLTPQFLPILNCYIAILTQSW